MKIGDQITVGVITPHLTPGADVEFPQMAPMDVRVQVARVADPASAFLADTPDVLVFASTGSGYALGHDEELALVQRLQERWGVPVHASCLSAVAALESRDITRVSLVHPPWFGSRFNELGVEYFQHRGFEVVDAQLAALPDDPGRIEPTSVVDWVSRHLSPRADAVFIGGNGFRAAGAIHALEAMTGRLVLEANQALLWAVLHSARGRAVAVRGFGSLFDDLAERT
jgi:maleate isomerase